MSSTNQLTVSPPRIEDRPHDKPILCGPGPANWHDSVYKALTNYILTPNCEENDRVLEDIRNGLQYVFQTRSKLVLAVSGAGHAAMETVVSNLVAPGETMLIAARGKWDERANIAATRYGIKTIIHQIPMNQTFTVEELEPIVRRVRPTALFITHGDSSTGTVQKMEGLGPMCHKYGALLLVDTVVSLGGVPFHFDAWEVDGCYTSTQKCFSGPAGISGVAFSERAQEKIKNRKHTPPFYFDIKELVDQWNCFSLTRYYHHTMSPPLIWALRACLQEMARETLPVSWERHERTMKHFHKRLEQLPVTELIPKPENRLPTVATVVLPKGYDLKQVCKYVREKHNIVIFAGLGPTVGKALRIGLMGVNSNIKTADAVADALKDVLISLKKSSL